ncbi:hypothetical protein [Salinispora mooreana]|uniref:hypothetical protein n=1 Tax=Salinispora mooreana TaxID=999545 RepID=UPI0003689A16|nr:hypothetical protein [Salinispora mooreana]
MVLRYTADTAAAAWLATSRTPSEQLITFGPAGYEAYARLRYIPDPTSPDQLEIDADIPADRELWTPQARRALHVLAEFTITPDQCFFCVWEGAAGSALSATERHGPLVTVPHRRYVLFTGRLADYLEGHDEPFDGDAAVVPAFVWPADHRWCFTSDVDTHWAGIGADRTAVDTLLSTFGLDVVQAMPNERPPAYR